MDSASARYLRGEDAGDVHPGLKPLLLPVNRRFMQTWAKYDPVRNCARQSPVLIVQAAHDLRSAKRMRVRCKQRSTAILG